MNYHIAGNFQGIQFMWFKSLNAHSHYSEHSSTKISYIAKSLHTAFPRKLDPSKISGYTVPIFEQLGKWRINLLANLNSFLLYTRGCNVNLFPVEYHTTLHKHDHSLP